MKRLAALLLVPTLLAPGCASRRPAMHLTVVPSVQSPSKAGSAATPAVWRQFAERLPPAAKVRVRTKPGRRLTGIVLAVDETALVLNPTTRVPEATVRVTFDEISQLELAGDSGLAKAAAVGAGVGAGVFFGLIMLLYALGAD